MRTKQSGDSDLNEGQAIAIKALKKFVKSNDQWFRLSGYAGTGKSFTLARFVRWLISEKIQFCVASPTHKALKNVNGMLAAIGLKEGRDYKAVTLAKLLGKVAELNTENGKEEFVRRESYDGIGDYELIIIEEYSMVSQETFDDIEEELDHYVKVVAVGDPGQLPPVNEDISPIAKLNCPSVTLTEIVRYEGAIAVVAERIRTDSQYQEKIYPFCTTEDSTIQTLPAPKWLDRATEMIASPEWQEDPDFCRLIVWRNCSVRTFNAVIRKKIHGRDVPDFIVGDRLVARSPIVRLQGFDWAIVADNREEFVVICEPELIMNSQLGWEFYAIAAQADDGKIHHLRILTSESEKAMQKIKKELAEEANTLKSEGEEYKHKWREYFDVGRAFDNVTHALCLTAHSAQGSSINNVFLYASEMKWCQEKQQILYTSLTRAKSACFVCP